MCRCRRILKKEKYGGKTNKRKRCMDKHEEKRADSDRETVREADN